MLDGRLEGLPRKTVAGQTAAVAATRRARLLGLAHLDRPPGDAALLLERCRSVHTFGMRFPIDLVWLDGEGAVVRVDRAVRPRRVRSCRTARAVLERPSENEEGRPAGRPSAQRRSSPRAT